MEPIKDLEVIGRRLRADRVRQDNGENDECAEQWHFNLRGHGDQSKHLALRLFLSKDVKSDDPLPHAPAVGVCQVNRL